MTEADDDGWLTKLRHSLPWHDLTASFAWEVVKAALLLMIPFAPVIFSFLSGNWTYILPSVLLISVPAIILIALKDRIKYKKIKRDRWDKIKAIKLGYIHYFPFATTAAGESSIGGFGPYVLDTILGGKVTEYSASPSRWKEITPQLERNKFQVFATPLLETFERSRKCDFTAPLFYSNIGLYTAKKTADHWDLSDMSLDGVVQWLNTSESKIRIIYIKGEISEKRAKKLKKMLIRSRLFDVKLVESKSDVPGTLRNVGKGDKGVPCLMFSESFHARKDDLGIANILRNNELLYPVCYAVRSGDYVLRTRINIGLLSLAKEKGILSVLEEYLSSNNWITQEEAGNGMVRDHFVAEWKQNP